MNFIDTLKFYYDKLPNKAIVTTIWKEIISGRRSIISSDEVIEYSFHYPVDTELYLEELVQKFDDSMKEDLRTIEGNIKAYMQTFLYYCIGSKERISPKTSLCAAELYLKIILLPSDIGRLYYERNMYVVILQLLNNCTKKRNIPIQHTKTVLELVFRYVSENEVSFVMIQGTANLFANILKYRGVEGNIKQYRKIAQLKMNFIDTLKLYYDKLPNKAIVTTIWKEIISGRRSIISSDEVIEYSFHYPVDTELYLEELVQKFDDSMKEDLRTIEGNVKAYMQTFLYYCIGSKERISPKTSLCAAELYLKIILLPSDIGRLYYERNMYVVILQLLNNCTKKRNIPIQHTKTVLELVFRYVSENEVSFVMIQGTANLFANILKYRGVEGNIKQCDDPLALLCLKSLKELITVKEHPREVKYIMESMLRCLRSNTSKTVSHGQRKLAVNLSKKFIQNVMLVEIEDKNKLQYFLDSLFAVFGMQDFDYIEDSVEIINMLDENLYKEFLRRIPNYLESKNHEKYYSNLMHLVYYMLKYPHGDNFSKLDVLFSVCFKTILIHLLNKKKQIQYKTIEILAKICLLQNSAMVNSIFEMVNVTGDFVGIDSTSILRTMIKILKDQYAGNAVRSKNILHILSKMLVALNKLDGNLSSQAVYLICKDGTPFSIKHILPNLHELYLQLSEKTYCEARMTIMRILVKMAMHSDASSSIFLEHLYNCSVYTSEVNGITYGPEKYSNILFSDEFDYKLFLGKCTYLIKYDDVYHIISHFNYKEPGYSILLNCLLDYIQYKEYNILTDCLINNFEGICYVDSAGHLFHAYKRILINKGVYHADDLPKFDMIHGYLWDSLFKQMCGIVNIKTTFDLIDKLKEILQLEDDEAHRMNLLTLTSERAYRALIQQQFHQGSIMHLTELCVTLRRPPRDEILVIFENMLENPSTIILLQTRYKETLIQLVSFFGTIAMMNRPKIPTAARLFRLALEVPDPVVQLTTIKMYYNLCTEISHEFEDIIKFCFNHVTSRHTVLSRVCVVILEELIHDNYILLNSEDFMRFVHRLASYSLSDFMKSILAERFLLSNKHDIGRFYITTLVYMSGHTKLDNYPVAHSFSEDLSVMRNLLDCPNDLMNFLFNSIQIKTRFSILREMCSIFDALVAGKCKVDEKFFNYFHYALYTFKVMCHKPEFNYKETFYNQVRKAIEKQIFNRDPKFKDPAFYGEYEADVRQCTTSLLELLFFIQNEDLLKDHLYPVFDTVACWIDHVKPELIQYVQYEKGKDYDHSLKKFVIFYKTHKQRLENFINNQERPR